MFIFERKGHLFYLRKDAADVVHFDLVDKLRETFVDMVGDKDHRNYPDSIVSILVIA
jgi:hypothetical protein